MGDESLDLGTFNCFQEGAVSVSYSPVAHVYFFDNMSTCHKCRLDWMGGGVRGGSGPIHRRRGGSSGLLLIMASIHGLFMKGFYMRTPKANWPMEICLIVSSAWLAAAMAAI